MDLNRKKIPEDVEVVDHRWNLEDWIETKSMEYMEMIDMLLLDRNVCMKILFHYSFHPLMDLLDQTLDKSFTL